MAKDMCVIKQSEALGRYVVASRDIKPGELICLDRSIIVGPRIASSAVCLECFVPISAFPDALTCLRCNVAPLCSSCRTQSVNKTLEENTLKINDLNLTNGESKGSTPKETNDNGNSLKGHSAKECEWFMNSKLTNEILMDNLQIIMPLRCLLLEENDLNRILGMEAHMDKRRNTAIWTTHQENIVEVLYKNGLLTYEQYNSELMQRICGILDVNSFEVRVPRVDSAEWGIMGTVRGLFVEAALLSHDCVGNTHVSVDTDFVMRMHSSVAIAKDDPIYFNYTNAMLPTWQRRDHLREGKYFECSCKRCSDPTELGTYLGAIFCPKCRIGYVTPMEPLIQSPFLENCYWICGECCQKYPGYLILATLEQIHRDMMGLDKSNERDIEKILTKLSQTLPSQHYLVLELKQNLAGLLRDIAIREVNPPKRILQRKLQLCREMVPLLKVLEPGISRLRGITLYEMHVPLVQLANREYESHDITAADLLIQLQEAESCLKESISLLLYEHKSTPEGQLVRRALDELRMLKDTIEGVKNLVNQEQNLKKNKKNNRRKHKK